MSGVAASTSCVNADPETIGRGMASAEEQQDEPSLGEWIALYTCRTVFHCRLLAVVVVAMAVCVCLWVGRVLHHSGMATFLVAVPAVTWLGKPWQFVPSMWSCIAQGAPLVTTIPIVFA